MRFRLLLMPLVALQIVSIAANGHCQPDTKASEPAIVGERIAGLQAKLQLNQTDGRAWNDLGVIYAQEENFPEARNAFIRAVQCSPHEGDYHRNLGLVFARLDMHDMAVAEFGEYRKYDKFGGTDYWRLMGGGQLQAGQIDQARATIRTGIEFFSPDLGPDGFRLVWQLKGLEEGAGNAEAVRELLVKYSGAAVRFITGFTGQDDPTGAEGYGEAQAIVRAHVALMVDDAELMVASGLPAQAADLYEQALKMDPSRDDLLPRLVGCYLDQNRTLDAGVVARLARNAHPEQAGVWIASAKVYEETDKEQQALAAYKKAYEIEPRDDLRAAIGNLYMRQGNDAEAVSWLKEGVKNGTAKPEVVYNYGVSLMREGKYHAALPSFRAVTRALPEFEQGWVALAQCLQKTGHYGAAAAPYQQAFALQPEPKLAFLAGSMAQKAKRYDSAIESYTAALHLNPGYTKARYNLALSYMGAKQYGKAIATFDTLITAEGPSYRVYYSQGLSHYYLGEYAEALEAYDLALEEKETVNVYNNIGLVYTKMGDKKAAAAAYKQAAAIKDGQ